MEVYCTRPSCTRPINTIPDDILQSRCATCSNCGMPLILQGHFVAIELLGSGGFGRTFKAIDLDFQFTYRVIKQLHYANPHGQILTPEQRIWIEQRFQEEAITLDKLNHPRIPKLLTFFPKEIEEETGFLQRFFYLVQGYIEGQNLAQELQTRNQFSENEVINMLKEILNILQYIHNDEGTNQFRYIHRDIKPANIMRCSTDGSLHLIDLGAVKQILQGFEVETTSIVLDPRFAPPEQFDQSPVSPASDLYATATTCVCLLTGITNVRQLLSNPNWRTYVTVTDQNFATALDRMLRINKEDRPQSATEVLSILSNRHTGEPEEPTQIPDPPRSSWLKRFFNWVRQIFRRWHWLRFVLLALFGLAIALYIYYVSNPPKPIANAQYFSRGEDVLIPRNQQASPECQEAYNLKDKGVKAFREHDFPGAVTHFNQAMQQFKQAAQNTSSGNKCEVDPETLIYQYNSQVAQTPLNLSLPTIAVVIPGQSDVNQIALEILRGVAQALNVQKPLFQVLIAKENIGSNISNTKTVATYI